MLQAVLLAVECKKNEWLKSLSTGSTYIKICTA
jgi:hypothetical protein